MITLCSIKGIANQENDSLLAGGESVKVDALLSILNLTSSYSQSDKLSSGYSVNILAQCSANILAQQPAKTLANQSPKFTGNQSGEYFSDCNSGEYLSTPKRGSAKSGEFTLFAKGDFSHLSKVGKSRYLNSFISKNGEIEFCQSIKKGKVELLDTIKKERIEFLESIKKGCFVKCALHHLRLWVIVGYSKNALAKSSVRIETLNPYKATHDAPSVFFCVYAYAYLRFAVLYRSNSMVMLAGQPKGWLVSLYASSLNPVSVTTPIEIETSGGDSLVLYKEIIVMMATPTQTHSKFTFYFLAVRRADLCAKPCRQSITAIDERAARKMLVAEYVLFFAGRVPAEGVAHV